MLVVKFLFVLGYFNEIRINYRVYVNIPYLVLFFIGFVLKSTVKKDLK